MEGDSGPQARQQGEASLVAGRPGACPSSDQGPTTLSPSGVFSRTQGSCLPSSPFPAKDAVPGPTAGVLFPKLWINESPAVPRGSVTTTGHPSPSQIPAPRAQRSSFSLAVSLGMSPTPRAPAQDRGHHLGLCAAPSSSPSLWSNLRLAQHPVGACGWPWPRTDGCVCCGSSGEEREWTPWAGRPPTVPDACLLRFLDPACGSTCPLGPRPSPSPGLGRGLSLMCPLSGALVTARGVSYVTNDRKYH